LAGTPGDLGTFNEPAASYASKFAVAKDEFKEPSPHGPSKSFLVNMPKDWLFDDTLRTTQVPPRTQMHFQ
jgi:hypothetical protein